MDAKLNSSAAGGEGVLANFFNSLLNKKTGSPGSPGSLGSGGGGGVGGVAGSPRSGALNGGGTPPDSLLQDKMSVRNDAAAELERLTRSAVKKEMDFSQSDCWIRLALTASVLSFLHTSFGPSEIEMDNVGNVLMAVDVSSEKTMYECVCEWVMSLPFALKDSNCVKLWMEVKIINTRQHHTKQGSDDILSF